MPRPTIIAPSHLFFLSSCLSGCVVGRMPWLVDDVAFLDALIVLSYSVTFFRRRHHSLLRRCRSTQDQRSLEPEGMWLTRKRGGFSKIWWLCGSEWVSDPCKERVPSSGKMGEAASGMKTLCFWWGENDREAKSPFASVDGRTSAVSSGNNSFANELSVMTETDWTYTIYQEQGKNRYSFHDQKNQHERIGPFYHERVIFDGGVSTSRSLLLHITSFPCVIRSWLLLVQ